MDNIKTSTEGRGRGSRIQRVQSASRPNLMHYTDGERGYCSCEHHQFSGAVCRHLRLVNAPAYTITRVEVYDGYRRTSRFDIHDSEGNYEGRCISFADAYEAIVDELGGVLGEAGVGGYFGGAA